MGGDRQQAVAADGDRQLELADVAGQEATKHKTMKKCWVSKLFLFLLVAAVERCFHIDQHAEQELERAVGIVGDC